MTPPYILSADAKDDLKEIWTYTADKGTVEAADKVVDRIFSECEKLGETPAWGISEMTYWIADISSGRYGPI